jgi:hypothetical protein
MEGWLVSMRFAILKNDESGVCWLHLWRARVKGA